MINDSNSLDSLCGHDTTSDQKTFSAAGQGGGISNVENKIKWHQQGGMKNKD